MIDSLDIDADAEPSVARERAKTALARLISYYGLSAEAGAIHRLFDLINRESLQDSRSSAIAIGRSPPSTATAFPFSSRSRLGRGRGRCAASAKSGAGDVDAGAAETVDDAALGDPGVSRSSVGRRSPQSTHRDPVPGRSRLGLRWTGGIWMALGASPGRPLALRLYVNQRWGEIPERFLRVGRAFAALGRDHSLNDWKRIAGPVSLGAIPYGVAFDVVPGGVGRFKVYLASCADRSYLETLLTLLGLEKHLDRAASLLDRFELDRPDIDPWGFLPFAGVSRRSRRTRRRETRRLLSSSSHVRRRDE